MLVNRKRGKGAVFLAALLVGVALLAIPALAACPPGMIDLSDPANYGAAPAPIDDTVVPAEIVQPGTYCIPSAGMQLPVARTAANELVVNADNVTIVGESAASRLIGSGASAAPNVAIITVNAGRSNVVLHNFFLRSGGGADNGIDSNGNGDIIEGITFEAAALLVPFPVFAVRLAGQVPIVQNNIFELANAGNGAAILLDGGSGADIRDNEMTGILGANPTHFVNNAFAGYNAAQIIGNKVKVGVNEFIAPNSFTNSNIIDNVAITWGIGIDLGATTTNTEVRGNELTYGANIAATDAGLLDAGGSNNRYINNTITASTAALSLPDDGIEFRSGNALIQGNTIDARGDGVNATGDGIDATGDGAGGASGNIGPQYGIIGNTILGTGLAGPGHGIRMWNNLNTNFRVLGNQISNTAARGIAAAGPGPVGGGNHIIFGNNITNTGIGPGVAFPNGTGISTNGNSRVEDNTITDVKQGVGILSMGNIDQILNNFIFSLSDVNGSGIRVEATGGNTIIEGNYIRNVSGAQAHGIGIEAQNCTIRDNTIDTVSGGDGIKLYDSVTVGVPAAGSQQIINNYIWNVSNGVGINLTDNDNNQVLDNTIENIGRDGILVYAVPRIELTPGSGGLVAPVSANVNTIRGNTIRNAAGDAADVDQNLAAGVRSQCYAGILVEGNADNNDIDDNTIENIGSTTYAVGIDLLGRVIDEPDNNDITNNNIYGFTDVATNAAVAEGIRVLSGQNNTISGNSVSNSGKLQFGIDVRTLNEVPITNNRIEGMREGGLYLWGGTASNPLVVQGNTLVDNATGIWMVAGAANVNACNLITGGAIAVYVDPLASAARFHFNGNCVRSPILCRNDGIGWLNATANHWASVPIDGVNVYGNVDVSGVLPACPCPGWDGIISGVVCCQYPADWNLISVPVEPNNPSAVAVYGQYASALVGYDPATGYFNPATVYATEGYWLYLPTAQEFCIRGTTPTTDQTIVLQNAGWHLIGTPFHAYWENTKVSHGRGQPQDVWNAGNWILPFAFGWDPIAYQYYVLPQSPPVPMLPCLGYWVYTLVDNVTLTIPFQQPPPPPPPPPASSSIRTVPENLTPPPPPATPGTGGDVTGELVFTNAPNPITDVHTTTFMVKGVLSALVEQIKVRIFDLSGRLVFETEEVGTRLDWHTDNKWGEYLANGVYLYKLYAWIDGQWVASEVKKLAIFR